MAVVLSGVQPSGELHLGNYLGAIRHWVGMHEKYQTYFCMVDLHALTSGVVPPDTLRSNTIETLATYMACGIDPVKSVLFNQSAVSGHAELAWLLGCRVGMGMLNRMTQFKEKAGAMRENASLGLFSYPVLMAADILLYKAEYVPVGHDQLQHLELTREVARIFNVSYGITYFPEPQAMLCDGVERVMSLRDGIKKMSKSDGSDYSRINLKDEDDLIAQKIRKATTDARLDFDFESLDERPSVKNLLNIYSVLSNRTLSDVCKDQSVCGGGSQRLKSCLIDVLIATIRPIRRRIKELMDDQSYLLAIMKLGNERASQIAEKHMREIKAIIGLVVTN